MSEPQPPLSTAQRARARTAALLPDLRVAVAITAAVALAVVLVPILALRHGSHRATEPSGVIATAGRISTVPDESAGARQQLAIDLSAFVKQLYEEAFVTPPPAPTPLPELQRLEGLFTEPARDALRARPGAFEPASGATITLAHVSFGGVATYRGSHAFEALLDVAFDAPGHVAGGTVVVRQRGTLLLAMTSQGWRVSGFDLNLSEDPAPASATPVGHA